MIELRDKATDELLGTVSDEELQFLIDELESIDVRWVRV